jgi:regulator of replication initiation timing
MSIEEEYIDWWVRIWDKLDELEKEVKILKKEVQEIKTYLENIDTKIYDFKDEV